MLVEKKASDNLKYQGRIGGLYLISLKNFFLEIITLFIYRPWAKTNIRRYIFGSITIFGKRLEYSGTGGELLIGLIKAFLIIAVLPAILGLLISLLSPQNIIFFNILSFFIGFFTMLFLMFYAKYAALRYKLSRTRWQGIKSGLGGSAKKYVGIRIVRGFLNIITLNILRGKSDLIARRYMIDNVYIGNQKAEFRGNVSALNRINFKTLLLSFVTSGISRFWYHVALRNYTWNSIKIGNVSFLGTFRVWPTFKLYVGNLIILIFTLGFGAPICIQRSVKFLTSNVKIIGNVEDIELLQNTQQAGALGEGIDSMDGEMGLDLDFSIW